MPQRPLARVLRSLRGLLGAETTEELSDGLLLERFVTGRDEQAFAALLHRHGPMVHAVCRRLLPDAHQVDDAFQAVFVVLVKRAHVVERERSLASWLYGVAYRVALKARGRAARRHAHEKQADTMALADSERTNPDAGDPTSQAALRELRGVIDDELNQLPDKYRAPLVLCYLEGKTNEQAARELGWPAGSMSTRLEKGRELLRQRLLRRGVTMPAGLLAVGLAEQTASAALPPALAEATLRTALNVTSGSGVSGSIMMLAEPVVRGMVVARAKVAALVLVSLTIVCSGGAWTYLKHSNAPDPVEALNTYLDRRFDNWDPTPAERRIDEVGWAPSIPEALRLARENNRPVFLFTHAGHIATGRCGGSAFNVRAYTLNQDAVLDTLNRDFVPVFVCNGDYRAQLAPEEDRKELQRIIQEAWRAGFAAGSDCVYILSPRGEVVDVLNIQTVKKHELLLARLRPLAERFAVQGGGPVLPPRPMSTPPTVGADDVVLHLVARVAGRKVWCEFPGENWIVLHKEDWQQLAPPAQAAGGQSWDVDPDLALTLLQHFYPQTENNDIESNRLDRRSLKATLLSTREGVAHIRLDGILRMKHNFYPTREDDRFVDATLLGLVEYDVAARKLKSFRLVTEQATYGPWSFAAAVRSLP